MNNERAQELTNRYVDGASTESEQRELLDILRESEEAREALARVLHHESVLREALRTEAGTASAKTPAAIRPARRMWTAWAAAAAGLLAAAGLWWWVGREASGAAITTGSGERVVLWYEGERTWVEVQESTTVGLAGAMWHRDGATGVRLVRGGPKKVIELGSGSILAAVEKHGEGRSFAVRSPQAEMTVAGTVFSVVSTADKTGLAVKQGAVRIRANGSDSEEEIRAGGQAVVKAGGSKILRPGLVIRDVGIPAEIGAASGIAYDGKGLWLWRAARSNETARLWKVDAEKGEVAERVTLQAPFAPGSALAWDGTHVWGTTTNAFIAVDVTSGAVVKTVPIPREAGGGGSKPFDFSRGCLWTTHRDGIFQIDPNDGKVVSRVSCAKHLRFLAASERALYVALDHTKEILQIDPRDGRVLSSCESSSWLMPAGDFAVGADGNLWVAITTYGVAFLVEVE